MDQSVYETIYSLAVARSDPGRFRSAGASIKLVSMSDDRRSFVALWREAMVAALLVVIGVYVQARGFVFDLQNPASITNMSVVLFRKLFEDLRDSLIRPRAVPSRPVVGATDELQA